MVMAPRGPLLRISETGGPGPPRKYSGSRPFGKADIQVIFIYKRRPIAKLERTRG